MGTLRQQEGEGRAACRARRSAGIGIGNDPVDNRVRGDIALPATSGYGHGVLRGRHSGLGRRSEVHKTLRIARFVLC